LAFQSLEPLASGRCACQCTGCRRQVVERRAREREDLEEVQPVPVARDVAQAGRPGDRVVVQRNIEAAENHEDVGTADRVAVHATTRREVRRLFEVDRNLQRSQQRKRQARRRERLQLEGRQHDGGVERVASNVDDEVVVSKGLGAADLSGANIATPLLFKIFNTIDYNDDGGWFSQPGDCDIRKVCSETGLLPGDHCPNQVMDYFIPLVSSTMPCNNRQEIMVSQDEKISYCRSCAPEAGYKKKWYRIIEPEMQAYFSENGTAYEKVPAHNPNCELIFKGSGPSITSPANGTEYLISKKSPEPLQLTCKTANDVSKVYWYINDKFYKAAGAGEKQFFIPEEGNVKISCTDDKGRNRNILIKVRYVKI